MKSHRVEKACKLIWRHITELIHREIKDPRIGFVTITAVESTPDLRSIKVFFSVLGDNKSKKSATLGLKSATGYIRREIGQRVRLRFTPEIQFKLDESIERGVKISSLLDSIKENV
ncbi:MAG: 30S ribosome-binding factor RbfA [Candidatus Firestonebacteria bacterium]